MASSPWILITVPNLHWVSKHVAHRLLLLHADQRYRCRILMPSNVPFENTLHHIVEDFMSESYDYWLTFDADNPPTQNPLDLVELDKDIIGCPTPVWHYTGEPGEYPICWNAYDYYPPADAYKEHPHKEGLQRVDAVGTGCLLVARRVFESPQMRQAPFQRKLRPTGIVDKGTDIAFCERARMAGFEIWAHYDYPCDHFVEVSLMDVVKAIRGLSG